MTSWSKRISVGIVMVLLLGGLATEVQGQSQVPGFGGYIKVPTIITGMVVCTDCRLDEVQKVNPKLFGLHLFEHERGQAVVQVKQIHNPDERARWQAIVGPSRQVRVRAADEVFEKLIAEENLFQEVKITAVLRSTRVLDIAEVEVVG
jgi:hypothetical protein